MVDNRKNNRDATESQEGQKGGQSSDYGQNQDLDQNEGEMSDTDLGTENNVQQGA